MVIVILALVILFLMLFIFLFFTLGDLVLDSELYKLIKERHEEKIKGKEGKDEV